MLDPQTRRELEIVLHHGGAISLPDWDDPERVIPGVGRATQEGFLQYLVGTAFDGLERCSLTDDGYRALGLEPPKGLLAKIKAKIGWTS